MVKKITPMLIITSTRDDRVHPAYEKNDCVLEAIDKNVLYYENIEGGHGGGANNQQAVYEQFALHLVEQLVEGLATRTFGVRSSMDE